MIRVLRGFLAFMILYHPGKLEIVFRAIDTILFDASYLCNTFKTCIFYTGTLPYGLATMYGAFTGFCSDLGVQNVINFDECKEATSQLEHDLELKGSAQENSKSYPRGCYIYSSKLVYWNTHPTGSSSLCGNCQAICEKEGT